AASSCTGASSRTSPTSPPRGGRGLLVPRVWWSWTVRFGYAVAGLGWGHDWVSAGARKSRLVVRRRALTGLSRTGWMRLGVPGCVPGEGGGEVLGVGPLAGYLVKPRVAVVG